MNIFMPPKGINFHLEEDNLDALVLSQTLLKIVSFLQKKTTDNKLIKYTDWWEHNGLHFIKDEINFNILFSMIEPPRRILENMPGVDRVFIGISPINNEWYLRFYLDWDDNGKHLEGRFDITVPADICAEFENEVVEKLDFTLTRQASEAYYSTIMS